MSDKILANFDYLNRKTTASVMFVGQETGYATPMVARVFDEQGVVNQEFALRKVTGQQFVTTYNGVGDFGLRFSSAGYDTSIYRTDLTGVYYSDLYTNWALTGEFGLSSTDVLLATLVNIHATGARAIDRRDDVYLDTPLLITRGDAVMHAGIDTVSGRNFITFATGRMPANFTGYNLDNSIVQVLSGSASGQTFTITDYTLGAQGAFVDRDVYSLSGQIIKIMPYRIINDYSGWHSYSGNSSIYGGQSGIRSRFNVSERIPNKIGSLYYNSGFYSGTEIMTHPLDIIGALELAPVSVVTLKNDLYFRDIRSGDLVFFNPDANPSVTRTGVILQSTTHLAGGGQGDIAIKYVPTGIPYTGSTFTIYRGNHFEVQSFPKFDSQYMVCISSLTGAIRDTILQTPSVEMDITANEFESTFASVPSTAHFHFGPVRLSNGQILDDLVTMTGGVPPYLRFSGQVFNGDVNSPTTVINTTAFSTQNTNIGHNYLGKYYSNGIFTIASETSFNASETLVCKAEIYYGAAKIRRVYTIPVQPAI